MKRMLEILFVLLLTVLTIPITAAENVTIEIRGVPFDEKLPAYNTPKWDAETFPGFWYAFAGGRSSETLKIDQPANSLTAASRTILSEKLVYETVRTDQKYWVFIETGKKVENGLEYNKTTEAFAKATQGDCYARLGWFGNLYVAVNGKANKLAKLVKDQKDVQTLKLGEIEIWNLGEGYVLTLESVDTKTAPRQAWLKFSKEGKTLDNKVVNEGDVYTYVEGSLGGESDVPVLVTYIENIFSATTGIVQLRYTWLISHNVTEIKAGDRFSIFEVKEADENHLLLYNKDRSISLDQNAVVDLAGGIKFRVANSATALRFYPFVEKVIQVPESVATVSATVIGITNSSNTIQTNLNDTPSVQPILTKQATRRQSAHVKETVLQKIFGFWGTYAIIAIFAIGIYLLWPESKNPRS